MRRAAPLLLLIAACGGPPEPPRNVLLVSVDTLRADHLGLYGYPRPTSPAIDALGAEGVVFDNAIVQWPVTTPSMASMFSGTYPHVTGIVILAGVNRVPPRLRMLAEVMRDLGFRTAGVVSNGVLGPHNNFPQGFEVYRKLWTTPGDVQTETGARRVTDAALAELARLDAGGQRFLLWVHYVDPHDPYAPPPGYAEPFLRDAWYRERHVPVSESDDPWRGIPHSDYLRDGGIDDLGHYVAAYDGEIRYADEQIGRLLEGLDALRSGAETLVVLTADHGESLGEHDFYLNHGHVPYEEQVRVPLLFRWPDRRYAGRRIAKPVELRGLAHTLVAAVGTPDAANPFEGANLLPAMQTGRTDALPDRVYTEAGASPTRAGRRYTLALRDGDLKLVLPRSDWARERHGGRDLELYDLGSDRAEQRDLAPERADQAKALREALLTWFASAEPWRGGRPQPTELDAKTREALRELGYLE